LHINSSREINQDLYFLWAPRVSGTNRVPPKPRTPTAAASRAAGAQAAAPSAGELGQAPPGAAASRAAGAQAAASRAGELGQAPLAPPRAGPPSPPPPCPCTPWRTSSSPVLATAHRLRSAPAQAESTPPPSSHRHRCPRTGELASFLKAGSLFSTRVDVLSLLIT
jgi:hypothetical protein